MDEDERHDAPTAAYDRTVDRLARGLAPVRRTGSLGGRCALWAGCALALVAGSTVVAPRPDLAVYLARSAAWVEVGLLVAMLVGCGALALRGAVPGREPSARAWILVGACVAAIVGLGVLSPVDQSISLAQFIARGVPCAMMTLGLAVLAALVPLTMIGRGFPLSPAATGAMAGIAGAIAGVLAMRLHCPMDEASHQLVFHASALFPVAVIGALVAWTWQRLVTEG